MIKNYIKIAFRNLSRSKIYAIINILGLAIGVACAIYITLFVRGELSYDRFNKHVDQIYRVAGRYDQGGNKITRGATTTFQLAPQLETQFPQIVRAVRIDPNYDQLVRYKDQKYRQSGIMYADSSFFDMFSFDIVSGKKTSVLSGGNVAVISTRLAKKYFGSDPAIGKTLEVNGWPVEVVAVMKSMPRNTHFHSGLVVSMSVIKDKYPEWVRTDWSGTSHYTYIQLEPQANAKQLEKQINRAWDEQHQNYADADDFFLQPLKDIHLQSHLSYEIETNGDLAYLYIFGLVATILLVIGCINYMNLATARTIDRTNEVGIRKILGAGKQQIYFQFFSESILIAFAAVLTGIVMAELAIPYINSLTGKQYVIEWGNWMYWGGSLFLLALVMGILSGSYPAFLLSKFNASDTIKSGKTTAGDNSNRLRKTLVVVQFVASIAILISTVVVFKQLNYMRNKKLGINPSEVVVVPFQTAKIRDQFNVFRDRLLANPKVLAVTATNNPLPSRVTNWRGYNLEGKEDRVDVPTMIVDYDFFKTLQAKFVAGRGFSPKFPTDKSKAYVINEAAAKFLGLENPVGKSLRGLAFTGSKWSRKNAKIIGVVKDFHLASLRTEIQPTIFSLSSEKTSPLFYMVIRLSSEKLPSTIGFLEKTWDDLSQDYPFDYTFLDQQIQHLYKSEQRFFSMFSVFATIAIIVACFGVFGLAAFSANRRRKEIGIRRVLGATTQGIIWLLSKEYVRLVLVANVIAWPVAWWFMHNWLQDFAYRVSLQFWPFLGMGALVLVIIALTVAYQAFKAANMNPVDSLRNE
ncbi:MAG TPA: ABC transporter permease [Balneolaceae bacterium]|nr:ABC transporter permease [Balneolaceae bacterium]